jgi:hypothetical protein
MTAGNTALALAALGTGIGKSRRGESLPRPHFRFSHTSLVPFLIAAFRPRTMASSVPLKEAYLEKKSPKSFMGYHPWQKRYFTLYFDRFVYKKSKADDGEEDLGV